MARSWNLAGAKRLLIRWGAASRRNLDYGIDITCDAMLGVRTFVPVPDEPIDTTARNGRYEPLPYRALRAIARRLQVTSNDVVLDLGCGKGRVPCFFGARGVAQCVGVEISPDLAHEARSNAGRLRWGRCAIEVARADAAEAEIGNASIIFMYNPFSAEVMRPVLRRIGESLQRSPRNLKICYANPVEASLLDECPWLRARDQFVVTHNGWRAAPVKVWVAITPAVGSDRRNIPVRQHDGTRAG